MNKVLHVGLLAPTGYTNIGLMNGFLSNQFKEYHLFDYQLKMYEFGKEAMWLMLIQEAEKIKPDLIFMQIQGSDILDIETFKRLSRIAFTVNFTFDIRSKEKTEWLYDLCPVLGLICFSNQRDVDECKRRGYHNTMVLQSSCDMDVYKLPDLKKIGNDYLVPNYPKIGIVFIGNNFENTNHEFPLSHERVEMVNFLKYEFHNQFRVYGNNWGASKITTQKDEIEIYQSAAIAINQNNFDEELYCSDRIWRIMATGAFCLTKYFKGIENLFTRYHHLDWWHTLDELKDKIYYHLEYSTQREIIAGLGMDHVRGNHNWECRIAEMMQHVKRLKPENKSEACMKSGAHVIDGVIPEPTDERFDNRTCDCGKLIFLWQDCGCQDKTKQLRAQENI